MPSSVELKTGNGKLNVDEAVRDRYSHAAREREAALCCPVEYNRQYLERIPQEIIDRDYGCGDPSRHVAAGETVLDLGSGGGKICYIAAQIVGAAGKVFGVDCNDEMLALARKYQSEVAETLGYDAVQFLRGRIQDLALNIDLLDEYLAQHPAATAADWLRVQEHARQLRETEPLIADDSIDVIVSNCVLNLVRQEDRRQLFSEMHRVLKRGGRVVVSDIVSDEDVPDRLRSDPALWSGCISGAFREDKLLEAFVGAGFYGIEILERRREPWAVVEGIEFRSLTLRAYKGKEGPCLDRKQAVIYNGPWKAVIDDDGHKLLRGERMAVCDKTFSIYTRPPYASQVTPVQPAEEVSLDSAAEFRCTGAPIRSPRETKGKSAAGLTILPEADCCSTDNCC